MRIPRRWLSVFKHSLTSWAKRFWWQIWVIFEETRSLMATLSIASIYCKFYSRLVQRAWCRMEAAMEKRSRHKVLRQGKTRVARLKQSKGALKRPSKEEQAVNKMWTAVEMPRYKNWRRNLIWRTTKTKESRQIRKNMRKYSVLAAKKTMLQIKTSSNS